MEQLTVFYRIFYDDLSPAIVPSAEQKKEYREFIKHYSDDPGYPHIPEITLLSDTSLRFYYYKVLLHKTVKEIRSELHHQVFVHGETEQQMRTVVTKFQRYINQHLQKIRKKYIPEEYHKNILEISEDKNDVDIYRLVYGSLVDLHDYLESSFSDYLDKHIVVPCKKRKQFIEQQRPKAELVLEEINNHDFGNKLVRQVGSTIERFLRDGFEGFTFSQMDYCKKLNKYLNLFFETTRDITEEEFIMLLVQLNFNRNGVLNYSIDFFNAQIENRKEVCKQLKAASDYLKRINRIQHLTSFGYNENLNSLSDQLLSWLDAKIHSLSLVDIKSKDVLGTFEKKSEIQPIEKIPINISVDDATLLLRVFFESNLLGISKTKGFEYFATYLKTDHTSDISQQSVKNGFYDITEKKIRTVRTVLDNFQKSLDVLEKKVT